MRSAMVLVLVLMAVAEAQLKLSNTLSDGMVLQRAPAAAVVWGFASPRVHVTTTFGSSSFDAISDDKGIWRQQLPPTNASKIEQTLVFESSEGSVSLRVLFGEVFMCGGQSNMAYTPRSMAGMNNMTAEIAAADLPQYSDIRLFTVGQGTVNKTGPMSALGSVYHNWTAASSTLLGGPAWKEFSAVCWLFGRDVHDALGVPVGLISSNWGATSIQVWMPSAANEKCNQGNWSGDRYNAMIAPFGAGPMRMAGAIWYQGESNNGQGRYYSCAFPAMINAWREEFGAQLWVGFVQIAGYQYGGASRPDPSGDLRQAQLAALALPRVAVSSAIDTGDWNNVHPPDKQTPSRRLAAAALDQIYGLSQYRAEHAPPLYASQALLTPAGAAEAEVLVQLSERATDHVPPWATASTTLGANGSIPRNECPVAIMPPFHNPQDCGYPRLYARALNGTEVTLNATAVLAANGSAIRLSASVPPTFEVVASSYGRASWPMTIFFSERGVPVLPWYATLNQTLPWVIPSSAISDRLSRPAELDRPWLTKMPKREGEKRD